MSFGALREVAKEVLMKILARACGHAASVQQARVVLPRRVLVATVGRFI